MRRRTTRHRGRKDLPPPANAGAPVLPPTELPSGYGRSRLTVLEVDPFHLYAYWEVTPKDKARAQRALPDVASCWVLRFHDASPAPEMPFDVPVDLPCASWYIHVWADAKTYVAEIGPKDAQGRFFALCRSNVVSTSRATPSPLVAPRWGRVERNAQGQAVLLPEPAPAAGVEETLKPLDPVAPSLSPPSPLVQPAPEAPPGKTRRRRPVAHPATTDAVPSAFPAPATPVEFGLSSGLWPRPDGPRS